MPHAAEIKCGISTISVLRMKQLDQIQRRSYVCHIAMSNLLSSMRAHGHIISFISALPNGGREL